MPVKDYLFYRDALLTFKCMSGIAPSNPSSRFIKRGTISGRSTRNANYRTYRAIKLLPASEAFYTAH